MSHKLNLLEEILLLVLNNETGKVSWQGSQYPTVLGGAILAELFLGNRIQLNPEKKSMVELVDTAPFNDQLLDEALERIASAKRPKKLQTWVMTFSFNRNIKKRVSSGLCEKGVLKKEVGKILGIFPTEKYPESNALPEAELIDRLEAALFTDTKLIDARTTALIALCYRSGFLAIPFDRKRLSRQKARIEGIVKGEMISDATQQAVQSIQAMILLTTFIPAITVSATN